MKPTCLCPHHPPLSLLFRTPPCWDSTSAKGEEISVLLLKLEETGVKADRSAFSASPLGHSETQKMLEVEIGCTFILSPVPTTILQTGPSVICLKYNSENGLPCPKPSHDSLLPWSQSQSSLSCFPPCSLGAYLPPCVSQGSLKEQY